MRVLFLAAAVFAVVVIACRRRRFDFFSVALGSALVYYLPAFLGVTADVALVGEFAVASRPIQPAVYGVLTVLFAGLGLGALVFDAVLRTGVRPPEWRVAGAMRMTSLAATVLACVGAALTYLEAGSALFDADKARVLAALGRWYPVWTFGAVIGFVCGLVEGRKVPVVVCALLLVFDVYVGFRNNMAIAVIGAFTLFLCQDPRRRLASLRHLSLVLGVVVVAAGFFVYKGLYRAVKYGAWDQVVDQVRDPDYLTEVVFYSSEPFMTTGTLNEVIRQDFSIEPDHYATLALSLVPFSPELGVEARSFNDKFQPTLFPDREAGLASNFLAEAYAALGWIGVLALTVLWVGGLGVGSFLLASRSRLARAVALALFPLWAFYIHRNDLLYQLVIQRRMLVLVVVAVVASCLVDRALRDAPRQVVPKRSALS